MGFKTKGGMWCEQCQTPVAGQKGTHRTRGAVVAVTAPLTGGLSLLGAKSDPYHCPNCGQGVRPMRGADRLRVAQPAGNGDGSGTAFLRIDRHPGKIRLRDYAALGNALEALGIKGMEASRKWGESLPTEFGPVPGTTATNVASTLRAIGFPVDVIEVEQPAEPGKPDRSQTGAPANGGARISELKQLAELRASGALTEDEFQTLKAEILAG